MKIEVNKKVEMEQLSLVICIGLLQAFKEGALTLEEIEQYFFSPYTAKKLEQIGLDKKITDIVWMGCELEDIASLIPGELNNEISSLINVSLKEIDKIKNKQLPDKLLR
ncbi:DUF3969 family protein [Marininema halotolerans]|uniref:DUF3969 family protein n=1 Tax=Marininema halotolerans TaxID=1155944 RepID=A0A1I6UU01_9BACL|nr:DUF3969 family protein [Marininema halotolerans]SFT04962.1 Protein of unknown function [Marininema halotolerans]